MQLWNLQIKHENPVFWSEFNRFIPFIRQRFSILRGLFEYYTAEVYLKSLEGEPPEHFEYALGELV